MWQTKIEMNLQATLITDIWSKKFTSFTFLVQMPYSSLEVGMPESSDLKQLKQMQAEHTLKVKKDLDNFRSSMEAQSKIQNEKNEDMMRLLRQIKKQMEKVEQQTKELQTKDQ